MKLSSAALSSFKYSVLVNIDKRNAFWQSKFYAMFTVQKIRCFGGSRGSALCISILSACPDMLCSLKCCKVPLDGAQSVFTNSCLHERLQLE